MQAVIIRQFGEPSQLRIEELPTPVAGPDDVLVVVHAASINPSDVKNVAGTMHGTTLPRIPGRDFAGVVVRGPADIVGAEVFGTGGDLGFTRDGSHGQFLLLPRAAVVRRPAALSMDAAACAGVTYVTAWSALVTAAAISAGEIALILGAAGGVGSAAVQIAKVRGATVIAAVRSDADLAAALKNGADHAINTTTTPLTDAVRALTNGQGPAVIFDTTGMLFPDTLELAALNARIPIITAPKDGHSTLNLRTVYRKTLRILGVDTRQLDATACARLLTAMLPSFAASQFRPAAGTPYDLSNAVDAYTRASHGEKVLLHPAPPTI
jgi:NADPH:quinone reductase